MGAWHFHLPDTKTPPGKFLLVCYTHHIPKNPLNQQELILATSSILPAYLKAAVLFTLSSLTRINNIRRHTVQDFLQGRNPHQGGSRQRSRKFYLTDRPHLKKPSRQIPKSNYFSTAPFSPEISGAV